MRILFTFVLCFVMTFCFAQNKQVEVTYKKTILIDVESKEGKSKDDFAKNKALELTNKVNQELENKIFKLWFNDSLSCFKELKKIDLENKSDMISMLSKGAGLTEGIFFTKKKSKLVLQQKFFDSKKYLIHSDTDSLVWEITKESKQIDDYKVFKATTTIKRVSRSGLKNEIVTVWYSPEIPTSFGPAGFNNLPGLILELQIGKISLYVSEINFDKEIDICSLEPKAGKSITKKDFINLELEQLKN